MTLSACEGRIAASSLGVSQRYSSPLTSLLSNATFSPQLARSNPRSRTRFHSYPSINNPTRSDDSDQTAATETFLKYQARYIYHSRIFSIKITLTSKLASLGQIKNKMSFRYSMAVLESADECTDESLETRSPIALPRSKLVGVHMLACFLCQKLCFATLLRTSKLL